MIVGIIAGCGRPDLVDVTHGSTLSSFERIASVSIVVLDESGHEQAHDQGPRPPRQDRDGERVTSGLLAERRRSRLVDRDGGELGAVGREQDSTPTSDGHMPTTVASDSAARPIGTIAFVVADWLVVNAHTRNRATARNSGWAVTMSPIEVITIGLASRYVAVIHARPNNAIAATKPEEMSGCFATSPGLMWVHITMISATTNIVSWIVSFIPSGSNTPFSSVGITLGRSAGNSPAKTMNATPTRKMIALSLASGGSCLSSSGAGGLDLALGEPALILLVVGQVLPPMRHHERRHDRAREPGRDRDHQDVRQGEVRVRR